MDGRRTVVVAERVIDADPTRVWSLLADPERIAEWAGLALVGYMGTELPRPGQSVFVKRRRPWSRPRRLEIENWDAGAGIRCVVHTGQSPTSFDISIHPEVESERIETKVRLTQRSAVPRYAEVAAAWWIERQLERKLDRVEEAVAT
jgi:uncharacterized protein YndB with AHSA1/START domain